MSNQLHQVIICLLILVSFSLVSVQDIGARPVIEDQIYLPLFAETSPSKIVIAAY